MHHHNHYWNCKRVRWPARYFSRVSIKPPVQLTSLCTSFAPSSTLRCILHSTFVLHWICSSIASWCSKLHRILHSIRIAYSVHCALVHCLIKQFHCEALIFIAIEMHSELHFNEMYSLLWNWRLCKAAAEFCCTPFTFTVPMYVLFCRSGLPDKDMTSHWRDLTWQWDDMTRTQLAQDLTLDQSNEENN